MLDQIMQSELTVPVFFGAMVMVAMKIFFMVKDLKKKNPLDDSLGRYRKK